MEENAFLTLTDAFFSRLSDRLEENDKDHVLSVDIDSGVLTIELEDGRQFVINKHAPTRQIWMSSPVSGGLHFSYQESVNDWVLKDGRTLSDTLVHELKKLTGKSFLPL